MPTTESQALRTVLLALLITAMGGAFFIEQPGSSYMEFYDKMRWLFDTVPVICPHFSVNRSCRCSHTHMLTSLLDQATGTIQMTHATAGIILVIRPRYTNAAGGWPTMAIAAPSGIRHFAIPSGQASSIWGNSISNSLSKTRRMMTNRRCGMLTRKEE